MGYRFGFNGMEKDDEVHDIAGSSYDFGARMYNSRLGRWSSSDPLSRKYPWCSPYAFVSNKSTVFVDPDGRIISFNFSSDDARIRIMKLISTLRKSSARFNRVYEMLDASHVVFEIADGKFGSSSKAGEFNQQTNVITLDARPWKELDELGVAEEVFHAYQSLFYGLADVIDEGKSLNTFLRTNTVRNDQGLANAVGKRLSELTALQEGNFIYQKNNTFVETESKLFKYLVGQEALATTPQGDITATKIMESDNNSSGGVGQKHLPNATQFFRENVSKDVSIKAMSTLWSWADRHNIKDYKIGGVIDKAPNALNSTSDPVEDYRPPSENEVEEGHGRS